MYSGYLLQGLRTNTLVAGKTTAFRLLTGAPQGQLVAFARLLLTILRPDGSAINPVWRAGEWEVLNGGTPSEEVVVLIPGYLLPDVGTYYLRASLHGVDEKELGTCIIDHIQLLPTKDLRIMVSRVWSNTGPAPKAGEVEAAREAMQRLAALYPVRDGISTLNGDMNAGLRYNFDNNPQGPPNQDGNLNPSWDPFQHPAPGKDTLDNALAYRFPDAGEGSGAITHAPYNGWLPFSVIVWEAPLGQVFSHESGHHYGMESPQSPHFDPAGQAAHSRDLTIAGADAQQGFDIQFKQALPSTVYDIMFPTGPSPGYPLNQIALNAWDWEFMRNKLMKGNSTGPHAPFLNWQSLGGHGLSAPPTIAKNAEGRLEAFVLGGDQMLYHMWENTAGKDWSSWTSLEGQALAGPVVVAANDSRNLQVFVKGGDGKIYSRIQLTSKGGWSAWFGIGNRAVKSFAVSRNQDGRLEMVATGEDGVLYDSAQLVKNDTRWSGMTSLEGHALAGPVALAPGSNGVLTAFALGEDGIVYYRKQNQPNGVSGWSAWASLVDARAKGTDIRAAYGADGRLCVFVMTVSKSIFLFSQTGPNGGWAPGTDLAGHDLAGPFGVGRSDDGRLEVAVTGGDHMVYSRWQIDRARPALWSDWTALGGKDIRPGVALAPDVNGQLEVFVIGGDGALYGGPRPHA